MVVVKIAFILLLRLVLCNRIRWRRTVVCLNRVLLIRVTLVRWTWQRLIPIGLIVCRTRLMTYGRKRLRLTIGRLVCLSGTRCLWMMLRLRIVLMPRRMVIVLSVTVG